MAKTSPQPVLIGTSPPNPSQLTFFQSLEPKRFGGGAHEDVENWLDHYDRVAKNNQWSAQEKLGRAYFYLDDNAQSWYENREGSLSTWTDFY